MPEKVNLLQEILAILGKHNKTPDDVLWVGTYDWYMSWDNFALIAKDVNYDRYEQWCYPTNSITTEVRIVGDRWWMAWDDHEVWPEWEFLSVPVKPEHAFSKKKIKQST